jgi:dolichyl-phosphate beta-glucosyltransferase
VSSETVHLSVVIPAYNEAKRIHATLNSLIAYLRSRARPFEVLVVDDGSTDDTAGEVKGRPDPELKLIPCSVNQGKGAAVRRGVAASRGELILLSDADLATPIEELSRLEARLGDGVAVVCGSRGLPDSRIVARQPPYRELMGKTFNHIVRRLGLSDFRDTQCGFKLFRAAAARDIFSRCRVDGFAFDVEALYLARRLGYLAVELPVAWRHVPESRVHPLGDAARMLWDSLRIRLYAWTSRYRSDK